MNAEFTGTELFWTIAYRPKRGRFVRRVIDWAGTWEQAREVSGKFAKANPDLHVYYLATRHAETVGFVPAEDIGNWLDEDTRKRIPIRDCALLPAELVPAETPECSRSDCERPATLTVDQGTKVMCGHHAAMTTIPTGEKPGTLRQFPSPFHYAEAEAARYDDPERALQRCLARFAYFASSSTRDELTARWLESVILKLRADVLTAQR